jgi:hypothetical protein
MTATAAQTGVLSGGGAGGVMGCRRRRGGTAQRVKARTRRSHFSMLPKLTPEMSTLLSPVQKGRRWRVQIKQPDGSVRYFGRFASENRAREWIATHAWLISHLTESND